MYANSITVKTQKYNIKSTNQINNKYNENEKKTISGEVSVYKEFKR